jgi:hypothetical protein
MWHGDYLGYREPSHLDIGGSHTVRDIRPRREPGQGEKCLKESVRRDNFWRFLSLKRHIPTKLRARKTEAILHYCFLSCTKNAHGGQYTLTDRCMRNWILLYLMVYLTTQSIIKTIYSHTVRWTVNNETERQWEFAIVSWLDVLALYFLENLSKIWKTHYRLPNMERAEAPAMTQGTNRRPAMGKGRVLSRTVHVGFGVDEVAL